MWKKLTVLASFLVIPSLTASAAVVTVNGQGGSERSALRQALRQAIEQQVGVMVDSRSYVQNYRLINDRIYTQADGYIKSYEILERTKDNGIYTVTADGTPTTAAHSSVSPPGSACRAPVSGTSRWIP